jgi:hypothetical protein
MRNVLAAVLLAASATLSTGCWFFSYGQVDLLSSGWAFDETQERFNRLVRWGHWEMAVPMVAEDERERFTQVMRSLRDVRFTDWDVLVVDMSKGFDTAHVEVRLEGYRETTLTQGESVMVQDWERHQGLESEWVVRPNLDAVAAAFAAR